MCHHGRLSMPLGIAGGSYLFAFGGGNPPRVGVGGLVVKGAGSKTHSAFGTVGKISSGQNVVVVGRSGLGPST